MTTVTREELDAVRNHIRNIPTIGAMYAPVLVEWCAVLLRERDAARAEVERLRIAGAPGLHANAWAQAATARAARSKAAAEKRAEKAVQLEAEVDRLRAEVERQARHIEALQIKIAAEKSCACSYDAPGDVCAAHSPALAKAQAEVKWLRERKNGAYLERNQVVSALSKCFPSGVTRTAIEGWAEDWHGCVLIDLPTGQASWHFHDSQAHLFAHLPPYQKAWDGHDTPEKYRRLAALSATTRQSNEEGGR